MALLKRKKEDESRRLREETREFVEAVFSEPRSEPSEISKEKTDDLKTSPSVKKEICIASSQGIEAEKVEIKQPKLEELKAVEKPQSLPDCKSCSVVNKYNIINAQFNDLKAQFDSLSIELRDGKGDLSLAREKLRFLVERVNEIHQSQVDLVSLGRRILDEYSDLRSRDVDSYSMLLDFQEFIMPKFVNLVGFLERSGGLFDGFSRVVNNIVRQDIIDGQEGVDDVEEVGGSDNV